MSPTTYQKFAKRWEEVTNLPPQQLGPLTPLYKLLVGRLKIMPWPAFFLISGALVVILYLVIGSTITILTSMLQKGF